MQNVIVPLNAFGRDEVLENGQQSYIECIAQAGAHGVEIRRELFPTEEEITQHLDPLKKEISRFGLFTVYSAPVELWKEDHQLNTEELAMIFEEAGILGAKWLKVSLGHFNQNVSSMNDLANFLTQHQEIQLLVENDQTLHGGNVEDLKAFFESALAELVPVKMTFDAGNWYYAGQKVEEALTQLSPYVQYLHLKQVDSNEKGLVTVPLQTGKNHSWELVFKRLSSAEITKAIEFPIKPIEKAKDYIGLIQEQEVIV